jgi:hypothetical protein
MRPTDRRVRTWAGKNFACPRSVATACSGALSSASTKIVAHRCARAQEPPMAKKNPAAAQLGRRGGKVTAKKLRLEQRRAADRKAAQARWDKKKARYPGKAMSDRGPVNVVAFWGRAKGVSYPAVVLRHSVRRSLHVDLAGSAWPLDYLQTAGGLMDTSAGSTRKGGVAAALRAQCVAEVTFSSLLFSFRCPSAS